MTELNAFAETLKGRPVAVFGLARSGLSVIRALHAAGIKVYAWDDQEKSRAEGAKAGAEMLPLTPIVLEKCAFLVLSPGVPLHFPTPHEVVANARAYGTEVICDIELFHRLYHGRKTIGVTGTNGKSTTTALIEHVLKACGVDAVMGGNIGKAVFDLAMPGKDGVFVFELSSYQLDLCPTFRPDIAVLLNITPDHLDRHGTMENYAAAKAIMFEGKGTAIISTDDQECKKILQRTEKSGARHVIPFSVKDTVLQETMKNAVLKGTHNYQNALAAYLVCKTLDLPDEKIRQAIQSFPGLPHRQYPVRKIGKVAYINDSKATNAEAAEKALLSYDNIFWIAGGRMKEGGLKGLESYAGKIRHAFLIGEAMNDFSAWMKKNKIPFDQSATLDKAVAAAHAKAQNFNNDAVILLSPACASFDQFSSYEERGDVFSKLVLGLNERAVA